MKTDRRRLKSRQLSGFICVHPWPKWVLSWLLFVPLAAMAEQADLIVTAHYVVPMDAQQHLIEDGAVAIRGERIEAVGKRADIEKQFRQHGYETLTIKTFFGDFIVSKVYKL